MSDTVQCDACGENGERRWRAIAPDGWQFLRVGYGDGEAYVYACSPPCKVVLDRRWEMGPGQFEPPLGTLLEERPEHRRPLRELMEKLDDFKADLQAAVEEISSAEDPRDATIRDLRALLGRCATALEAAAVRHWGYTGVGLRDHEQDCSECRPLYALLAALRSAGVEPSTCTCVVVDPFGSHETACPDCQPSPEKGPTP